MKTYKYQPEKKSRIFDSSLKASNQLPLSTILLKYGEKMEGGGSRNRIPITNGVIQKELSNDFDKNHLNVAGETHHEVEEEQNVNCSVNMDFRQIFIMRSMN